MPWRGWSASTSCTKPKLVRLPKNALPGTRMSRRSGLGARSCFDRRACLRPNEKCIPVVRASGRPRCTRMRGQYGELSFFNRALFGTTRELFRSVCVVHAACACWLLFVKFYEGERRFAGGLIAPVAVEAGISERDSSCVQPMPVLRLVFPRPTTATPRPSVLFLFLVRAGRTAPMLISLRRQLTEGWAPCLARASGWSNFSMVLRRGLAWSGSN